MHSEMSEFLVEFIEALTFTVVMAIIVALIDRGRRRVSVTQPQVLKAPRATFVIVAVCSFILSVPFFVSLFFPEAPLFVKLLLGLVSLPGLWLMASCWRTRFEIGPTGIFVQTLFTSRTWLSWDDVTRVRWAMFRQSFVLNTRTLGNISIDAGLCGLPGFARQLLVNVTADRIDANARELLVNTSKGVLPELRGG